jgi:ribosomal protein S3AE
MLGEHLRHASLNSAKIYPLASIAVQKAEAVEQLKIHSTLIGQQISTNISNFSPLGG